MNKYLLLVAGLGLASIGHSSVEHSKKTYTCFEVKNNKEVAKGSCTITTFHNKKGDGHIIKSKKIGNHIGNSFGTTNDNTIYTVDGQPGKFLQKAEDGDLLKQCYIKLNGDGFCMGFTEQDLD